MFKELLEFELDPPELPADDIWAAIFGEPVAPLALEFCCGILAAICAMYWLFCDPGAPGDADEPPDDEDWPPCAICCI